MGKIFYLLILFVVQEVFAKESLDQALDIVLSNDERILAAKNLMEAQNVHWKSLKRTRWPKIQGDASRVYLDKKPTIFVPLPVLGSTSLGLLSKDVTVYGVGVSVPLFTSGKIQYGIKAAEELKHSSGFEADVVKSRVKLEITESYVNVLRAQKMLEVAKSHLTAMSSYSENVEQLYKKGVASKSDYLSSATALAGSEQAKIHAEHTLKIAYSQYNRLMGRNFNSPVDLIEIGEISEEEAGDIYKLSQEALEKRKEIHVNKVQVKALQYQQKSMRGDQLPQVGLMGFANKVTGTSLEKDTFYGLGLFVTWNIFDSGKTSLERESIAYKSAALEHQGRDLSSLIELEVQKSYYDYQDTVERMRVANRTVKAAEESFRETLLRYRRSVATNTDVLNAESQRVEALTNYNNSLYDSYLAKIKLKYSVGVL